MNLNINMKLFLLMFLFFIFGCNGQSSFDKAFTYQKVGDYQKAIEYYNKAIAENKNVADAEKNLADIFFRDKKYEDSFAHYKNAIEFGSKSAADTVIRLCSFNDKKIRELSLNTISDVKNGKAIKIVFDKLLNILKSKEENKIIDALEIILNLKIDISPLSKDIILLLDNDNIIIKQKVLLILPKFSKLVYEDKDCFNKIIEYLSEENEKIKSFAIDCLGNMGQYAQKTLPILIDIAIKEPIYKNRALNSISKIGVSKKDCFKELYPFLQDKPNYIKESILEAFKNMPIDDAKEAVPCILLFLENDDFHLKQKTMNILKKIGKAAPNTVPELIDLLGKENNDVVSMAIYELIDLEKDSYEAIEPLKKLAETTTNKDIKKLATEAVKKIQQ